MHRKKINKKIELILGELLLLVFHFLRKKSSFGEEMMMMMINQSRFINN